MAAISEAKVLDKAEKIVEGMLAGFSVAVYGCGSKTQVLDGVFQTLRTAGFSGDKFVRIKGYDQTFPLIRTFSAALVGKRGSTIRTQADVIKAVDKLPKSTRLFVIIDSIDGVPLRNHQEFLSEIASRSNVHLCASVDHSKVGLLWSSTQSKRFRWIWIEASTYVAYTQEVKDLVPFWKDLIEGRTDAASRSLEVLSSLTGSHSEIIQLIAKMQLDAMGTSQVAKKAKVDNEENADPEKANSVHVRSTDLVKRCKKAMIADNQQKMRSLLQELIDHRLVINSKDKETGNEMFWLPFDQERLQELASGVFRQ